MYRYTTPTFTLTFPEGTALDQASQVFVSFGNSSGEEILRLTGDAIEVSDNVIEVYLSQEQTKDLPTPSVQIQANWIYTDGNRACSNIVSVSVRRNMLEEVLP